MTAHRTILITGGTGYIGGLLRRSLAHEPHTELIATHHASPPESDGITTWIPLNLEEPQASMPDCSVASRITHIIHCAGLTSFAVTESDARRVNVEGTRALLSMAGSFPNLQHIIIMSSLYASGLTRGVIPEEPVVSKPEFANAYEWSKWTIERDALTTSLPCPVTILRVGTVLIDDREGHVIQQNVVHRTLRLVARGVLPLLPGTGDTLLPFTSGMQVAQCISLLLSSAAPRVVHCVAPMSSSPDLDEAVCILHEVLSTFPQYCTRALPPPRLIDPETYAELCRGVAGTGSALFRDALRSLSTFAPQLYVRKEWDTSWFTQMSSSQDASLPLLALAVRHIGEEMFSGNHVRA